MHALHFDLLWIPQIGLLNGIARLPFNRCGGEKSNMKELIP